MSHKTKDCLERPRSKGARWTGKNIAADDKVEDITMVGFESKRDRWNGYDAKEYEKVGRGGGLRGWRLGLRRGVRRPRHVARVACPGAW
jgi:hypothetical protein